MRKPNSPAHARFRIGDAQVQPDRMVVSIGGQEQVIEPRIMEVLVALAEAAEQDEVLSAEQLLIKIWGGTFYGDNPVHKAITYLRKVFHDDPKSPRYIETIRKRGYRLIADVSYPDDYRRVAMRNGGWLAGSPYVGLSAFDADHATVFLGRSRTTAELLTAMRRQIDQQRRLVLIVGASGCGKTSLLNAGAIPLLTQDGGFDGLHALSVARCDLAGTSHEDACERLCTALMQWALDERPVFAPQPVETLAKTLHGQPESITATIDEAFRRYLRREPATWTHAHLLLVIDHAEALVADPAANGDTPTRIDRILHHLCECPRVCVIIIVRGDFYLALAEAMPGMTERKSGDGHIDVLAPRAGEIAEIIRIPAARAGLVFQRDPISGAHLDDVIRDDAIKQPDALPLLQHALQMLYDHRNKREELRFDTYREIGGLEGALTHHAEQAFGELPSSIQACLDHVLARIVVMQPENDSISARRLARSTLDRDSVTLAEAFVKYRLFVAEYVAGQDDDAHYRVAHEALLRQWPRAVEWVRENRRILVARIRLQRAATRWVEEGRCDDHLLNPGAPLEEAVDASAKWNGHDEDVGSFLQASIIAARRKKRLRTIASIMLVLLTAASLLLASIAVRKSEESARRKEVAQDFIGFMLNDVNSAIDPTGDLDLPERISRKALNHYGQMKPDEMEKEDLSNLASALRGLGIVELSRNREREAARLFAESSISARAALSRDAEEESAIFELAQASYWSGLIHYNRNNFSAAMRDWNSYLDHARKLRSIAPNQPKWIMEESYALNNLGVIAFRSGDIEKAIPLFASDITLKRKAIAIEPNNAAYQQEYADSRSWMTSSLEANGRILEAASAYQEQIKSLRRLVSGNKQNEKWKFRLANLLQLKAIVEMQTGRIGIAGENVMESISILKSLTEENPERIDWKKILARGHVIGAEIMEEQRNAEESISMLREATAHIEDATLTGPLDPSWERLAIHVRFLSAIRLHSDMTMAAASIAQMQSLLDRAFSNEIAIDHSNMLIQLGKKHASRGDEEKARDAWTRSISTLQRANSKRRADWNRLWVEAHWLLGRSHETEENVQWLKTMGYRPPSYIALIASKTARSMP